MERLEKLTEVPTDCRDCWRSDRPAKRTSSSHIFINLSLGNRYIGSQGLGSAAWTKPMRAASPDSGYYATTISPKTP